jgi:alkanesulfonate monooxygenase SsuD/methylene tetrahydromethanopterin reductase-like flavin-dependent oxidoreductase (luciferase family)
VHIGAVFPWNPEEYHALGVSFDARAAVLDEQIEAIRAVWTEEIVHSTGTFHDWPAIGFAPRPRRAIPLWFGGTSQREWCRVARRGDGWIAPRMDAVDDAQGAMHHAEALATARAVLA